MATYLPEWVLDRLCVCVNRLISKDNAKHMEIKPREVYAKGIF